MGRARDIRLLSDYQKISQFTEKYHFVSIQKVEGMPPVEYLLEFELDGYINASGQVAQKHEVKLMFPEQYPFSAPPKFSFSKGLFHPNVYKNGDVCHGWYLNNWHPGIHIEDLLLDITKMICFKTDSYNLKSPANFLCDANWIAQHQIPIDPTPLQESYISFQNPEQAAHVTNNNIPEIESLDSDTSVSKIKIKAIRNLFIHDQNDKNRFPQQGDTMKVRIEKGK